MRGRRVCCTGVRTGRLGHRRESLRSGSAGAAGGCRRGRGCGGGERTEEGLTGVGSEWVRFGRNRERRRCNHEAVEHDSSPLILRPEASRLGLAVTLKEFAAALSVRHPLSGGLFPHSCPAVSLSKEIRLTRIPNSASIENARGSEVPRAYSVRAALRPKACAALFSQGFPNRYQARAPFSPRRPTMASAARSAV